MKQMLTAVVATAAIATGSIMAMAVPSSADTLVSCERGSNVNHPPLIFLGNGCMPASGSTGGAPHRIFVKELWDHGTYRENVWLSCADSRPGNEPGEWIGLYCG